MRQQGLYGLGELDRSKGLVSIVPWLGCAKRAMDEQKDRVECKVEGCCVVECRRSPAAGPASFRLRSD